MQMKCGDTSVRFDFSVCLRAATAVLLACAALYVAMLLFQEYIPEFQWNMNDGFDLDAAHKNCDICKKAFYGLFFATAPIGVVASLYFPVTASGSIFLSAATIFVTFVSLHCAIDLRNLTASAVTLSIGIALAGFNYRANLFFPDTAISKDTNRVGVGFDLLAIVFLIILLTPSNLEAVTANVLNESHKVSYFIGPALYHNASGLVPGLDFHSHYGLALGWFFHAIMGNGWKAAAEHAVGLNIAITLAVYLQAYFLLSYLIRSRLAAILIVVSLAVLAFSTDHHFYSPSAYPTRFPLLIVFAIALGLHCRSPERIMWLLMGALMAAAALLWETETGIFFSVAGATVALVAGGFPNLRSALVFTVVTAAAVVLSCLALFGPRILSVAFVAECLRPILLYGAGWGSVPIKWGLSWGLIYNLPLQIVGCLTIGWAAVRLSQRKDEQSRFVLGVLLTLSLIGVALMIKWVNRSYDAVWHQNALPLVIVASWWLAHFSSIWRRSIKLVMSAAAIVATFVALLLVQDSGNPTLYGIRSYVHYPSLLNWPFISSAPIHWQADFGRITATETAFIDEKARPDERVLIVAFVDWAYLAEAKRAPRAFFVPLLVSFDGNFIQRTFDGADILFFDKITEQYKELPRVAEILNFVARDFAPVETRGNLMLYKRRTNTDGP